MHLQLIHFIAPKYGENCNVEQVKYRHLSLCRSGLLNDVERKTITSRAQWGYWSLTLPSSDKAN